jgi:hypothetical protein
MDCCGTETKPLSPSLPKVILIGNECRESVINYLTGDMSPFPLSGTTVEVTSEPCPSKRELKFWILLGSTPHPNV